MGLFGKMFDKKECAICGGEIGLLGNRKLADGNLCKDCASKLSPFMTDRRESTVEEIRQHLAYREENARILPSLRPTRVFGTRTKVYVDEAARKFFVSGYSNWLQENPDVIDISQVAECRVDVREEREQLYRRDREGRRVPYEPPRFRSQYRFWVTILVNSPYFSEIGFELTDDRPDSPISPAYRQYEQEAYELQRALDEASYAPQVNPLAQAAAALRAAASAAAQNAAPAPTAAPADSWVCKCGTVNRGNFCVNCGAKRPATFRCSKCGWVPADPANPPKFCPQCGDPFTPDDAV